MRYMQIIEAQNLDTARQSYLQLLEKRGIPLVPSMVIYVEAVHRGAPTNDSFLCYLSMARPQAA